MSNRKIIVSLLRRCEAISQLRQIHAQVVRVGLLQDNDVVNKLMAFVCDPTKENVVYAHKLFNIIEKPSLLVYNLLIKVFMKNGKCKDCVNLFSELRRSNLWPDNFTYPFVLKAIACLGAICAGENLHGFAVKTGMVFDCYVCNSLMNMYNELGRVGHVAKLFEDMPQRDVVSWNVVIAGHVKCGRFEDAIDVFCRMRTEGNVQPNEATLVSTLSACTALKSLKLGMEIHSYVSEELGYTLMIGNALLDMYCKLGCLSKAEEVFHEIPSKSVVSWTTLVSGFANLGKLEEARKCFERSPVKDLVLWTVMLNGYVQFDHFEEAIALFREMQKRRIKPDKFVLVTLLTGCAQVGALEQGKWFHAYIVSNRVVTDAIIGTALIEMYSKCGCVDDALGVFNGVREKDTALWTSVICGLSSNGETRKALEMFSKMVQVGVKPDDITFISLLSACSHGGLVEEGKEVFKMMTKVYHIEPKIEHFSCLIDLFSRAGRIEEAEALIKKIPLERHKMEMPLFGALLSACRVHGNVEIGERLAEKSTEIQASDSSIHSLLANIYASTGRWDDELKVRRRMKDLRVRKPPGSSFMELEDPSTNI